MLSLRDAMSDQAQPNEEEIIRYLELAPNYCAVGKVIGDKLNPDERAAVFPGMNTDGIYLWPMELAYYVRKYHVRLPKEFIERMASLNWKPPAKSSINYKELFAALAKQISGQEPPLHGDSA